MASGAKRSTGESGWRACVGEEALGEQGDVLAPVAQGGDLDGDDVEAVEEVLAERAGAGALAEVAVGGGDDPHVDRALLARADGAHGAALEHVQQLGLEGRGHLADLVEQERAAVGLGEEARARGGRAREGALHVAEELALEQGLGKRGAVDGDERAAGAAARGVDRAGQGGLARAGLAHEEHRASRRPRRARRRRRPRASRRSRRRGYRGRLGLERRAQRAGLATHAARRRARARGRAPARRGRRAWSGSGRRPGGSHSTAVSMAPYAVITMTGRSGASCATRPAAPCRRPGACADR